MTDGRSNQTTIPLPQKIPSKAILVKAFLLFTVGKNDFLVLNVLGYYYLVVGIFLALVPHTSNWQIASKILELASRILKKSCKIPAEMLDRNDLAIEIPKWWMPNSGIPYIAIQVLLKRKIIWRINNPVLLADHFDKDQQQLYSGNYSCFIRVAVPVLM